MKRYVLDASAYLAFVRAEMGADRVEQLLIRAASGQVLLFISVINWGEILSTLWRSHGHSFAEENLARIDRMGIEVVDVDRPLAKIAAALVVRYALPYADGFAAATAMAKQARLVAADRDFERVKSQVDLLQLG
jgi:predicted nucleic acid-binding protein